MGVAEIMGCFSLLRPPEPMEAPEKAPAALQAADWQRQEYLLVLAGTGREARHAIFRFDVGLAVKEGAREGDGKVLVTRAALQSSHRVVVLRNHPQLLHLFEAVRATILGHAAAAPLLDAQ